MKKLQPAIKIVLASLLGTAADHITTKIALKYPDLYEANPVASFKNEFLTASVGGISIYGLAKLLKQSDKLSLVMALIPAAVPVGAAVNNIAWITWAHRKEYPWEEMPLLYPEAE